MKEIQRLLSTPSKTVLSKFKTLAKTLKRNENSERREELGREITEAGGRKLRTERRRRGSNSIARRKKRNKAVKVSYRTDRGETERNLDKVRFWTHVNRRR